MNHKELWFIIIGSVVLLLIILNLIFCKILEKFLYNNSSALQKIKEINQRYKFKKLLNFDHSYYYDNENYFDMISPKDCLISYLDSTKHDVKTEIYRFLNNKRMYELYINDIKNECIIGKYTTEKKIHFKKYLIYIEKILLKKEVQSIKDNYNIEITMVLSNYYGRYKTNKKQRFYPIEILELIERIENKVEDYYLDREIWQSIAKVERGKVTNKMRFSIYNRDNYRCRICGKNCRYSNDLEIDHIVPIARGGKSVYNNLQSLCRRCNKLKGSN